MLVERQPLTKLQSLSSDELIDLTSVAEIVTLDTEGVEKMMGVSVCFDGLSDGFYLPFNHARSNLTQAQIEKFYGLLHDKYALVFHNAVHDLRVLARNGFDYRGRFYDTMLMAHWINEERNNYSLDAISQIYGGKPKAMPASMRMIIDQEGWDAVPVDLMIQYSGNDAFITHELFHKLWPQFIAQGFDGELWDKEQEFVRDVMGPMIDLGVKIDAEFCVKEAFKGQNIMAEIEKELGYKTLGKTALQELLIDKLNLPVLLRTPKGDISFKKEAMEQYEEMLEKKKNPLATTILRYRGWQKTVSANYKSYLTYADSNSVLHPGYKLHGTVTGRLACEKPALQQIPKSSKKEWNGKLKSAFVPREGYSLWTIDYSQLQFRMACSYANEEMLIDIFNDAKRDIFTEMAAHMGWLRDDVKTLVYLMLFGGGATKASHSFQVSIDEGKEIINEFYFNYPGLKKVAKQAENAARAQGYVQYWTGRRRHFPKGSKYYRAFNAVIQGGEAEIMKRSMIELQKSVCSADCRMVLQIHDEIAFEIKLGTEDYYLPRAQKVMEEVPKEFCRFTEVPVAFRTSAGEWGKK